MNDYMKNKLSEEDKKRLVEVASALGEEEMSCVAKGIHTKILWEELVRRENCRIDALNGIAKVMNEFESQLKN